MRWILLITLTIAGAQATQVPTAPVALGTLIVKVERLRNSKGQVWVAVFDRESGFPDDDTKAIRRLVAAIGSGEAEVRVDDLPYADYAVAIHHDENNDGKMNRSLFGLPKEGYGVSNNIVHARRAPSFVEARFRHDRPSSTVTIGTHY